MNFILEHSGGKYFKMLENLKKKKKYIDKQGENSYYKYIFIL